MPRPVGHIRNPFATRNGLAVGPAQQGVIMRAPEGFDALATSLQEMAEAGVDIVIIDGGDGTVRDVISRAAAIWTKAGLAPPRYAIIAHGNTNLIARSAGQLKRADIARLVDQPTSFRLTELNILQVSRQDHPDLKGFIMGAGAYETATRIAQEELSTRHGAQVIHAVVKLVRNAELRKPSPIGIGFDGQPVHSEDRTLVGVSTLPGALLYRLQPFWGSGEGSLRWLDIAAQPRRLLLAAPFIAFGAPRRWMQEHYKSGRAHRMTLQLRSPFVLDGESFDPGADDLVQLSADETATFLASP